MKKIIFFIFGRSRLFPLTTYPEGRNGAKFIKLCAKGRSSPPPLVQTSLLERISVSILNLRGQFYPLANEIFFFVFHEPWIPRNPFYLYNTPRRKYIWKKEKSWIFIALNIGAELNGNSCCCERVTIVWYFILFYFKIVEIFNRRISVIYKFVQ